ncbi:NAD(P)-binding domain-containing protein [Eubacterium pyruvativorans]|uniref:NAD(P)-binding domain-containing protein n=1 Tax=Eubacterium pyruvativorans TaxID=155865 RepID=UPI0015696FEE|nr:NAD(P)-binding domain-containing protein [Eubacterium pyruvativorans]
MKKTIAVIGAGSWGTALAMTLAHNGHTVKLTTRSREHIQQMRETRRNERYLPGMRLEDGIQVVDTDYEAIEGADMVVFAAPAQHFRSALTAALPYIGMIYMEATMNKQVDNDDLLTNRAFLVLAGLAGIVINVYNMNSMIPVGKYLLDSFSTGIIRILLGA